MVSLAILPHLLKKHARDLTYSLLHEFYFFLKHAPEQIKRSKRREAFVVAATGSHTRSRASNHSIGSRYGDIDGPHRLTLLRIGSCNAGDAQSKVRAQAFAYGAGHGDGCLFADGTVRIQNLMWHTHLRLELRAIGNKSADKVVRAATDIGDCAGKQPASK